MLQETTRNYKLMYGCSVCSIIGYEYSFFIFDSTLVII